MEAAAELTRPLVGIGTMVVPLLNGVDARGCLSPILGPEAVVGGVAFINASITAPGRIERISPFNRLVFGEWSGAASECCAAFAEACRNAGVEAAVSGSVEREIWNKFVLLVAFSSVHAVARGNNAVVRSNPRTEGLIRLCADEAAAVGRAAGIPPGPDEGAQATATAADFPADSIRAALARRQGCGAGGRTRGAAPSPISVNLFQLTLVRQAANWAGRRRGGSADAPGIGFHWWITRVKGRCGSMVRATWLGTNPKSPGGLRRPQVVSPRGNGHGAAGWLFHQRRDGELAVRPRLGAFVVVFGRVSQLRRRPEAPEDRPDPPPGAVPPQHLRSRGGRFGQGGEHDDVARELQGARLNPPAFACGLLVRLAPRGPACPLRLSDCTHAPRRAAAPPATTGRDPTAPARSGDVTAAGRSNGATPVVRSTGGPVFTRTMTWPHAAAM